MITDTPLLLVIAGPTAVGKTRLAVTLAKYFQTEIISADSRQFYREMTIGTAVPSREELAAVPHHFIHHLSVHDNYNAARYEGDVLFLLERLFLKYRVVIMTGGSGLYIEAVCHGIDELPDPDPAIRSELKEILSARGIAALQEELARVDPVHAAAVDLQNPARLIRALEVCRMTGRPYSSFRSHQPKQRDFRILKLGLDLPREWLFSRINERVDRMMQAGLLAEAESLWHLRHLNALNTVGYSELFDHQSGKLSLSQAVEKIKTNTRRYARRQLTWFRRDPGYRWFLPEVLEEMVFNGDIQSILPPGRRGSV